MGKRKSGKSRKMKKHRRAQGVSHIWTKKQKFQSNFKPMDLIYNDLATEKAKKILQRQIDVDLPGLGQNYCLPCE